MHRYRIEFRCQLLIADLFFASPQEFVSLLFCNKDFLDNLVLASHRKLFIEFPLILCRVFFALSDHRIIDLVSLKPVSFMIFLFFSLLFFKKNSIIVYTCFFFFFFYIYLLPAFSMYSVFLVLYCFCIVVVVFRSLFCLLLVAGCWLLAMYTCRDILHF